MPSAYTLPFFDGKDVTFSQFALNCARAMNVLVTLRDIPLDAPLPNVIEPSKYHLEHIEKAKQEILEVKKWSLERAEMEAQKSFTLEAKSRKKNILEKEKAADSLLNMLMKVNAWRPPTSEFVNFKRFMFEQLAESLRQCIYRGVEQQKRLSGKQYQTTRLRELRKSIQYHAKNLQEDVGRAEVSTQWLRQLRNSL